MTSPAPAKNDGVELAHRHRQLDQQVRRGPPARAVAHRGAEPARDAPAAADGRRPGDVLAQQPRRQAAVRRAEPAGDPGRQHEQRQQNDQDHTGRRP